MGREKKKMKQVSTAPMGKKKKKKKAGIQGPDGQGKTKRRYPRSRWTKKYVFL